MSVLREGRSRDTARLDSGIGIDDHHSRLEQVEGHFDLIFLDADKHNYQIYIDRILERRLSSPQGIVLVDNGTLFLVSFSSATTPAPPFDN